MFREWLKGCTNCSADDMPWECAECTPAMIAAVGRAMDQEETEESIAFGAGQDAAGVGVNLLNALRTKFGTQIDECVRRELGDVVEQRDNAMTANTGLRIELHMTQEQLKAANAAVTSLAKGAGISKAAHLQEQAVTQLALAEAKARIADLERTRR
tara:strand:+ start:5636 stop:6103 length:468 start_codon:yes stop_codon:yes gene_type:complete